MANEQIIDQVIAPVVDEQVLGLTKMLADLDIQMSANIKSANLLNATTSNSKSFTEYSKNATQTALALEKIQQAQNKTAQTTITLDAAQKKAAEAEQVRQDKALIALQKKQQVQAQADAKEIANAEAKAAKLQAIMDEANRKANVQFPQSQQSNNPVTNEPDSPMAPGIANSSDYEGGIRRTTLATQEQTAAMVEQAEVLAGLSTEYRANLELLLTLKAEQSANSAELKELTVQDAASGERAVFLTAEQLRLKTAIQQTNTALAQETKEMAAQAGSANELNAQLSLLRADYNALSTQERENIAVGGVMLTQIEKLDIATKQISASQGVHNKEVGNYALAQGKANVNGESAVGTFTKIGRGIGGILGPIRQLAYILPGIGLAGLFNLAFEALAKLTSGLDIFSDKVNQAESNLKALNEVQKDAAEKAGESVGKFRILSDTIKDGNSSYKGRLAAATELKKLWPLELEHSTAQAIANGTETASLDKLTDSVVRLAKAKAAATQIEKVEGEIIALQIQRDKVNAAKSKQIDDATAKAQFDALIGPANANSDAVQKNALSASQIRREYIEKAKHEADLANKDIADQIKIKEQTVKYLEKFGGLQAEAETLETKPKINKARDDRKHILEEQLRAEKEILDATLQQENISYEQRFAAIDKFEKKSDDLVKDAMKNKVVTNLEGNNLIMGIDNEANKLILKYQEEFTKKTSEKLKEELAELLNGEKEKADIAVDATKDGSEAQLLILQQARDKESDLLDDKYSKGKISQKKYNDELLAIDDQYNLERLAQIALADQTILEIKQATLAKQIQDLQGNATPEDIEKLSRNLGIPQAQAAFDAANLAVGNAFNKQKKDKSKPNDGALTIEKEAAKVTEQVIDEVDKLRQRAYENEIKRLEKIGEQIDENANNEKQRVNDSIASSATKAREIAVIEAQQASAHKALIVEENKVKTNAARADKEANIAKIIVAGALAVAEALTAPPGVGEVLAIIRAAAVAVELAIAIATPLPKYAKGTDNYPGGLGIWGEAGMERARLPSGEIRYSTGAEVMNFPKGTVITPHMDLMRSVKPAPIQYVGGEAIGWGEVLKQLKKMESKPARNKIVVNVDNGYESYQMNYLRR